MLKEICDKLSLRKKVIFIICFSQFFWVIIHNLVMRDQFTDQLDEIEYNQAMVNVDRVQNQITQSFEFLVGKLGDYSGWIATYNFIEDHNHSYIENDLGESMLMMSVNLMIFVDKNGDIVWSQGADTVNDKLIAAPKSITKKFLTNHSLSFFDHKDDEVRNGKPYHRNDQTQGIVALPEGIMLIVSRPILKSDYSGPARGYMLIGKWLDNNAMSEFSKLTSLDLSLGSLPTNQKPMINFLSRNLTKINIPINDIYGKPLTSIVISTERPINQQKIYMAYVSVFSTVIALILLVITTLFSIDYMVLKRIKNFRSIISSIRNRKDLKTRVNMPGNDELSSLAESVDEMLDTIEQSRIRQDNLNTELLSSSRLATIGTLVNSFAHEINNPLTIAKCNLEMLDKYLTPQMSNDEKLKAFMCDQDNAIDRIIHTVKKFGSLSESIKEDSACIDLNSVIEQSLDIIESRYQLDNIELIRLLYAPLTIINGSSNKFQQIILNLLSNAHDALNGRSIQKIIVQTELDNNVFVLKVTDTGNGIEADKVETIFDPLTLMNGIKNNSSLGLPMAYRAIKDFNGDITCSSKIHEGTVFTIRIPITKNT